MNDKRIEDFATVSTLQDDDLFLVGGNGETFNATFATIKKAVSSGGGGSDATSDVTFYDYDGSVVAAYTQSAFAKLKAMPANPAHEGLTSQGWNWSFEDAKAYVAKYGRLNVGQMYITDDGKERFYIHIEGTKDSFRTVSIYFGQTIPYGVELDWGDGSPIETFSHSKSYGSFEMPEHSHTYSRGGDYIIKLHALDGKIALGESVIRKASNTAGTTIPIKLKKIELSSNITIIRQGAFRYEELESVIIPYGIESIDYNTFTSCKRIKCIIIPNSVKTIYSYAFSDCISLNVVVLPNTINTFGNYIFRGCTCLKGISLPESISDIPEGCFYNCTILDWIIIPNTVVGIDKWAFYECVYLIQLTIPENVTDIFERGLQAIRGLCDLHMKPSNPPFLGQYCFVSTGNCIIYVPYSTDHSILEAYKTAENWSTYASYMQEEPQ